MGNMAGMEKIRIKDHDCVLTVTYRNLVNYHGRTFIGGVAMAFQLLRYALSRLSPERVPKREEISIRIGVNGPGIIDGIEMTTRAKSRRALTVDSKLAARIEAPDAADGLGGKYYFEVTLAEKTLAFALRAGIVSDEFIRLSYKTHSRTITPSELRRLQRLKEEVADQLLRLSPEDLFETR